MGNKHRYIMAEAKNKLLEYFLEQITLTNELINAYEGVNINNDSEVKKLNGIEVIKLRDRIDQLNKHVSVVKLIL